MLIVRCLSLLQAVIILDRIVVHDLPLGHNPAHHSETRVWTPYIQPAAAT